MKIINIKILAVILFGLFLNVNSNISDAQAYESNHPPLFVVRFNQNSVLYKKQLFFAVSEAVKTKPSVVFDVVAYSPVTSSGSKNAKHLENSQYYGKTIADDLIAMGVNPQQVTFKTLPDRSIKDEEVKIFVR